MKAIFASKLYRNHPNKEHIRAALANPVNAELVQQLREYLDPEYLTREYFPDPDTETITVKEEPTVKFTHAGSPNTPRHGGGSSPVGNPFEDGDIGNAADELDDVPDDITEVETEVVDEESDEEPDVDSATSANGTPITASINVDVLQGTLNSQEDTAGAIRTVIKDNELWIYYPDKTNLNTVMTPVIELLNRAGFSMLEFSRLARSNNAIVFDISYADTSNVVRLAEESSAND